MVLDLEKAENPRGIRADTIQSQMNCVLSNPVFLNSPQASRLLSYVVQKTLSGQSNEIKQYTIAVEAFSYPADFDPLTNTAVRVLAGRLRRMLEQYYAGDGSHDDIRIEIPKRTYVPVFRLNSKLQDKTKKQNGLPLTHPPGSIADYGPTIAIIPFSGQGFNENEAMSITMLTIAGLTRFSDLHIVGPLMKYKDIAVEIVEIARQYHVRFVLQGLVQTSGEVLRVTTVLTDTRTGFKVWSETYECELTERSLAEIDENISHQIVCTLADYTGVIPNIISQESMRKHFDILDIHEAIYRHEHFLTIFTPKAFIAAVGALKHAVEIHPDSPLVLSMLGSAYATHYMLDMGLTSATLKDAERLAQQAVALNPQCQMAHWVEGYVRFLQGEAERCIAKFRLACSINPLNAYCVNGSAVFLCMMGHWEEGLHLWEQIEKRHPKHPPIYSLTPFMYSYVLGDYESAWSHAVRFDTPMIWDPLVRAAATGQLGLHKQSRVAIRELLEMRPDFPTRARDLIKRVTFLDEHVEMLMDGLYKAGLDRTQPFCLGESGSK